MQACSYPAWRQGSRSCISAFERARSDRQHFPPFALGPGDADMHQPLASALILYPADLILFIPPDPVVTFSFWPFLLTDNSFTTTLIPSRIESMRSQKVISMP